MPRVRITDWAVVSFVTRTYDGSMGRTWKGEGKNGYATLARSTYTLSPLITNGRSGGDDAPVRTSRNERRR